MRKLILAGALAGALSGVASAQFGVDQLEVHPTDFSFRAGLFLPFDERLQDISGTFVNLGMEYVVSRQWVRGSESYLAVDWFSRSFRGDRGNVIPVSINQRFYQGLNEFGHRRGYYFLGLGAFFIDTESSQAVLGLRGGVGTHLSQSVFVEATAYVSDRTRENVRMTGIALNLGYRF
jgi:hypothetical protein